jgi:hypothetical protein
MPTTDSHHCPTAAATFGRRGGGTEDCGLVPEPLQELAPAHCGALLLAVYDDRLDPGQAQRVDKLQPDVIFCEALVGEKNGVRFT